jgi:hypothetical protein
MTRFEPDMRGMSAARLIKYKAMLAVHEYPIASSTPYALMLDASDDVKRDGLEAEAAEHDAQALAIYHRQVPWMARYVPGGRMFLVHWLPSDPKVRAAVTRFNPPMSDIARSIAVKQLDITHMSQREREQASPLAVLEVAPLIHPIPWVPWPTDTLCMCVRIRGRWQIGHNIYCVVTLATDDLIFSTLVWDRDVIGEGWLLPDPAFAGGLLPKAALAAYTLDLAAYPALRYPSETNDPWPYSDDDLADFRAKIAAAHALGRPLRTSAGMPGVPIVPPLRRPTLTPLSSPPAASASASVIAFASVTAAAAATAATAP